LALKRAVCFVCFAANLTSESVQGTSLSLESIDDVHGGDGLPLGVFGVGNSVTDNVLEENLKNTSGFFVDEAGDTLDTTTTGQTPNCGLGDTLDVVSENLSVSLGASFS